MIGNISIDLSLKNIWQSYYKFRAGKIRTCELDNFAYYLEKNLFELFIDLNSGAYQHGGYRYFTVNDNKKRRISVANLRDRIVHRLVYEYLIEIYDKTFIYDIWSNRKNKGLIGAINRTQYTVSKYEKSWIWKADIRKYFDSINHITLLKILSIRVKDERAFAIIESIVKSYFTVRKEIYKYGIPIGNLTSQIFANIYLNEFDRFIKNNLKSRFYLRYGDDFIVIAENEQRLRQTREAAVNFLRAKLNLRINKKNDIIIKPNQGLKFLGQVIYTHGQKLNKRNISRLRKHLKIQNLPSYRGLALTCQPSLLKEINWRTADLINQ